MYKMSVIIPCYKATDVLSRALHSIAMQSIADEIEVLVVNDCDNEFYGDIIARFKPELNLRLIMRKRNGGCGASRNTGIREATSPFIVFLDSDDCFTNCLALQMMYTRIKAENADMLVSVFESEMRFTDGVAIKKMDKTVTWCHGKAYRRQYLLDNDLFFDERLRINEDAEFHQILIDLGAKVVEIPMTTLMWRDNPKSVTHENLYKNKRSFVQAAMYYIEDCKRRNLTGDKVTLRVLQNLSMIYYYYNVVMDDTPKNEEDFLEVCREYWRRCEPIVANVEDDYITKVYLSVMKTAEIIPTVTFVDFLNKIRN